jgi:hypothetical protein
MGSHQTIERSGRLDSGNAISKMATRPRHRPNRRRAENRSMPKASAMGKDSIGISDRMIDKMPEGRWMAAV